MEAIRKENSASCKFGSLLVCIFFYVHNTFTTFGKVAWKTNRSDVVQILDFIEKLGDNFDSVMTSYFEDFKKSMKQRLIIPVSLVEKHYDDVYLSGDANHTYV